MPRIQTTGDLRAFLTDVMVDLREGRIDPAKAGRVAALASQINASFLAEIAIGRVQVQSGETAPAVGTVLLAPASRAEVEREERAAPVIEVKEEPAPAPAPAPVAQPCTTNGFSAARALVEANDRIRAAKSAVPAPRF